MIEEKIMPTFQCGDPYGTRTRVFAVKGQTPLFSMPCSAFGIETGPNRVNGLQGRGNAFRLRDGAVYATKDGPECRYQRHPALTNTERGRFDVADNNDTHEACEPQGRYYAKPALTKDQFYCGPYADMAEDDARAKLFELLCYFGLDRPYFTAPPTGLPGFRSFKPDPVTVQIVNNCIAMVADMAEGRPRREGEALRKIAAFDDTFASDMLAGSGTYAGFDEPGSVEIARAALAATEEAK